MANEEFEPAFLWNEAPVPIALSVTETAPGRLAIRGPLSTDPLGFGDSANYAAIRAWVEAQDAGAELVLDIDSPGGDVAGLEALAAVIADHPGPTVALVTGVAGSAAYWLASSCDRVVAWPSAVVGSVGAMIPIYDGGDVHDVVAARSARKNAADDPQWQELVDDSCDRFLRHVAQARGWAEDDLDAVAERCGNGKIMTASEAVHRGLVDNLVKEGTMDPNEMPEVVPAEEQQPKSAEEELAEHRARLDDLQRRIEELQADVDNLKREKADEAADEAADKAEEAAPEAACKPKADAKLAALTRQVAEMRNAQRDDLVARLVACGKIDSADADVARLVYDVNPRLFTQRYGKPAAIAAPVTRISSGAAAPVSVQPADPTQAAFAALARGEKKSFVQLYKEAGGR